MLTGKYHQCSRPAVDSYRLFSLVNATLIGGPSLCTHTTPGARSPMERVYCKGSVVRQISLTHRTAYRIEFGHLRVLHERGLPFRQWWTSAICSTDSGLASATALIHERILPSMMRSSDSCLCPDFTATLLIGYYGVQMRGGSEEYCPSRVRLSDVRDGTTLAGILHKQGRRPKA